MRLNKQSEPYPFIHMNPLSRNRGTAPAMPIMDGHPGWNGMKHGRMGGCTSYLVGLFFFGQIIYLRPHFMHATEKAPSSNVDAQACQGIR